MHEFEEPNDGLGFEPDTELETLAELEQQVVELDEFIDESPDELVQGLDQRQRQEAEAFALEFLQKVVRLRGVRVDRAQFLRAELHKRGTAPAAIEQSIAETPVAGGITPAMLDEIALASIRFETRKSSALSFASGLPGGIALLASVPADITQFYVHAFRVMQKLAYVYGWQSLLDDADDIDDETLGKLVLLLGVMMGVGAASGVVTNFAANVARPAVEKQIARVALTKTAWYGPMKQVLRVVGVKVTKQTFAKTVAKSVPLLGGAVSGGMTMLLLDRQSKRLMLHLREIPPPGVDAAEYLAAVRRTDEETAATKGNAELAGRVSGVLNRWRADDGSDDAPDLRVRQASKDAAAAVKGRIASVSGRLRPPGDSTVPLGPSGDDDSETSGPDEHSGRTLGSLVRRRPRKGSEPKSGSDDD